MKSRSGSWVWRLLAVLALAAAAVPLALDRAGGPSVRMSEAAGEAWTVPGEWVVQTRDGARPQAVASLAAQFGLTHADASPPGFDGTRLFTVRGIAAGTLAALRTDPAVAVVTPQRLMRAFWTPNDPRFKEQWNFQRIGVEKAWEQTRGKGAVVAVIDTGVAFEQDARCRLARDFGQTRFVEPYDFVHRDRHPNDDAGHGTHVAGTIAESTNNGEGVAGIAFEASIMPLKVLTREGYGRISDVAAAIRYAADHGAHVVNLSLGGPLPDPITQSAVAYAHAKGVTIVAAAGNTGSEGVGYPAAYAECIAVSALGPTGEPAPYSTWGREVAISAPGGDKSRGEQAGILQNTRMPASRRTEAPEEQDGSDDQVDDYYFLQGTSMATPHVSGVAALVVASGISDPDEVRAVLRRSAQPRGDVRRYGAGELDADAAVRTAGASSQGVRARLAMLAGLWVLALALGLVRRGSPWPAQFAGALALTVGMLLPDLVEALAGYGSTWNLVGHSVLLPAYLLGFETDTRKEARFFGLMAAGAAAHLALDLAQATAPFLGGSLWAALPWLWANVAVGFGVALGGLRRSA